MAFTETDYVADEGSGSLEALIIKEGENTATITLIVTPMTYGEYIELNSMLPSQFSNLPDPAECKLISSSVSCRVESTLYT